MSSTNNSTAPPPILELDPKTVIGPIFIGNCLNWMLMGTLIVQVYIFFVNYAGDRIWLRILVYGVFALDIVQTIWGTHQAWYFAVAQWNNFDALAGPSPWTAATIPIMCGLISAIVQIFYAWRIWTLKHTLIMRGISVFIVLIALSQCLTAIIASSIIERTPTQEALLRLHPAFEFWLVGSFVADILIAGSMIRILYDAKSRTPWSQSKAVVNKLITNVIQTGSATVICAGIDLALFVSLTNTTYHLTPAYILGKLYSNSLMVSLNARKPSTPPASLQSSAEAFGMRVRVSHETVQTTQEREVDQWPRVKLSQIATTNVNMAQTHPEWDANINNEQVQVLGVENPSQIDVAMA